MVEECLELPINLFTRQGLVEREEATRGEVSWSRPRREAHLRHPLPRGDRIWEITYRLYLSL